MTFFSILKYTFITLLSLFVIFFFLVFLHIEYSHSIQLRNMKNKLNNIPNVEVIDIWGHEDITLEEITARLRVCDTNEIVMANLSKDVFNYPEDVFINEINGYSFIVYQADCGYFNLGTKSPLHKDFGLTFYSPEDVIQNIDSIYNFVKSLKVYPKINYFCDTTAKTEMYLHVINEKSKDVDPLFSLFNIKEKIEFANTLEWKYRQIQQPQNF